MDIKSLAENLELDEDEYIELVELLIETMEEDITELHNAVTNGNLGKAVSLAHSIKGASGNLGLMECYEVAKALERKARDNNSDGIEKDVDELKKQLGIIVKLISDR